jgi:SSS family solute:Na+ symporter
MGLALFVLYALAMLVVIRSFKKHKASERSFYINNRSSSAVMVACSIVASCIGASAAMGTVGLAFDVGTPAFWWLGSGAAGLCVMAAVLARRVRSSRAYTLPEMLEKRCGSRVRRLVSAIIVVAWTSILAAQFVAVTQIIGALTGLAPLISLVAGAALIVAHTLGSGQSGIIRLDRIQCLIMLAGLLSLVFWLARSNPAAFDLVRPEVINERFPLSRLLYFLLVVGGSYVVCPMLFGRLLSAESEQAAQRGALGAVAGLCFFSALIVMIGLLSRGLIPAASQPDQVLTAVVGTVLPAWLAYAVYLTLLSIIVSSADSCLITAGLILAGDLLQRKGIGPTRGCIIVLAGAGALLTFTDKSILGFLLMANDIYVCGAVAPIFIALLAGENRKARPVIITAGLVSGGALGLLTSITGQNVFSYLGVSVSGLLAILSFHKYFQFLPQPRER